MFTFQELRVAVAEASARLKGLKEKYKDLEPHLVFSSSCGQVEVHSEPGAILRAFPDMVVASQAKTKAIEVLKALKQAEANKQPEKTVQKLQSELSVFLGELSFKGDTQVEVRLDNLEFKLIRQLKKEASIDRVLTMQNDASIRIVMGTVRDLAGPK